MSSIDTTMDEVSQSRSGFYFVEILNSRAVFAMILGGNINLNLAVKYLENASKFIQKVSRASHKSESVIYNNLSICYSLIGRHNEA